MNNKNYFTKIIAFLVVIAIIIEPMLPASAIIGDAIKNSKIGTSIIDVFKNLKWGEEAEIEVILESGVFTVGDRVKISLRVNNDNQKNSIDNINATFRIRENNINYSKQVMNYEYNSETGYYDGYFTVDEETPSGEWELDSVYMYDENDNCIADFYYNKEYSFQVIGTNPSADYIAPTFKSIDVTKNATVGQEVLIEIDAEDDKSGINYIRIWVYNPNYENEDYYATLNEETNKYEIKIPVTEEMAKGIYEINEIQLVDNQYNYNSVYSYDINKGFRIYDKNSGITESSINATSIWLNRTEVMPGDDIDFTINAQDLIYGIKSLEMVYENKNKETLIITDFNKSNESSGYKAVLNCSLDNISGGNWSFKELIITNNNNEQRVYKRDGNDSEIINYQDFRIVTDTNAPYVVDHYFDKDEATIGDTVKVMIDARDDESGIDKVLIEFRPNQYYLGFKNYEAIYNEESGFYEYDFVVDKETISARWSIDIGVYDNEGNSIGRSGGRDFTVKDTGVTIEDYIPKINEIKINKTSVSSGETVKVQVDAKTNKIDVEHMYLWVNDPTLNNSHTINLAYNEKNKLYEGEFIVEENAIEGKWEFSTLVVRHGDYSHIYYEFGSELPIKSFMVTETGNNEDITKPQVEGIINSGDNYYLGDLIKLGVYAKDNQSGIKSIKLSMEIPSGETIEVTDFIYSKDKDIWEIDFEILKQYGEGRIVFKEITVEDNAGNITYKSNNNNWLGSIYISKKYLQVEDIKIDKNEVSAGDAVNLSIKLNDETIKDANISILYQIYEEYNYQRINSFVYNDKTGYYDATFNITKYTNPGKWIPNEVVITSDEITNYYYLKSEEIKNNTFEVSSDGFIKDTTAPVFKSIWLDKELAMPGDKVKIYVDAEDEESGINSISVNFNMEEYSSKQINAYNFNYNETLGVYEAEIEITEKTPSVQWFARNIMMQDNSGNYGSHYVQEDIGFTVTGTEGTVDYLPPTLNFINVGEEFTVGEQIKIEISADDDMSGISEVELDIREPQGSSFSVTPKLNDKTGIYEVIIDVTEDMQSGYYELTWMKISDKDYNTLYMGTYDLNKEFRIYGTSNNTDIEAPKAENINVNKSYFNKGETIEFSIKAYDKISGIKDIVLTYASNENTIEIRDFVYDKESKLWKASLEADKENIPSGYWSFDKLVLVDEAGNERVYGNGGEGMWANSFTVKYEDIPPTINNVSVDNKNVTVGDKVKISVDTTDASGISRVDLEIQCEYVNIGYNFVQAKLNEETGLYEYEVEITEDIPNGVFNLAVNVYDNEWNLGYKYVYDFFTVYGTPTEKEDYLPTIEEIESSTKEVNLGETIDFKVKLKAPKISVENTPVPYYISVGFSTMGGWISVHLEYDELSGYYIGAHTVTEQNISAYYTINNLYYNSNNIYKFSDEIIEMSQFKVTGTEHLHDIYGPKLNSVTFNKEIGNIGETLEVIVDAEDQSGFCGEIIFQMTNNSNIYTAIAIDNNEANIAKAQWKLDDQLPSGEWKVYSVQLFDNKGNRSYYFGEELLEKTDTVIITGSEDTVITDLPEFKNISINKTSVATGDTFKISVEVEEGKIPTSHVIANYRINDNGYRSVVLNYNKETKLYEAIVTVNDYTINGIWKLESVIIVNSSSNPYISTEVWYDAIKYEMNADIEVTTEGKVDNTEAIIKDITVDKNIATIGDTITYTANIIDAESGISSVMLSFDGKGGPGMMPTLLNMKYNSTTGLYEGSLLVTEQIFNKFEGKIQPFSLEVVNGYEIYTYKELYYREELSVSLVRQINKPVFDGVVDIKIEQGDEFNALTGITATDVEDGNLTNVIKVSGEVNVNIPGEYTLTYTVTDSDNNTTIVTRVVTVNYRKADFNKDGVINEADLDLLSEQYNKNSENAEWNSIYDLNNDGVIDLYDIVILSGLM